MNSHELRRFRQRLESELAELARSTSEIEAEFRSGSESSLTAPPDVLDSAKCETDLNTRSKIHNHSVARQVELRRAIARIETGQFGICQECEEDIDPRRLEAAPSAILCLYCQHAQEKGAPVEPRARSIGFVSSMIGGDYGQVKKTAA